MRPAIRSDEAYHALYKAAEQLAAAEYKAQLRHHTKTLRRRPSTFRFCPTAELDALVNAMSDESITDEQAMALLHVPEIHNARFQEGEV